MCRIGIDIGTTSISEVVLDTDADRVLEAVTIPSESFIKTANEWEKIQDVGVIIRKTVGALDELLKKYPETDAIGLTGQMHGILYTDREGTCVSPLYTWQDQRGGISFDGEPSLTEEVQQRCGVSVPAGYGLLTHLWMERAGQIPQDAVSFCTIPDYLGMVLTGRTRPLMHSSMAASLGFFDPEENQFLSKLLEQMGMHTDMLPEVTASIRELGTYRGRMVAAALGDNQASFLGSVGMQENTVLLNVGTGSQISVLSGKRIHADGIEVRPLTDGSYLLVGSSLCGGRAYAVLENFFRKYAVASGLENVPQYEIMEKLAQQPAEPDPMLVETAFNGTRTDPEKRGSIRNLSEANFTPEGLVRGVLTGMADELYEMFQSIQAETGIRADLLVASGNGVRRNRVLQQIFENKFQAELKLSEHQEEAACGAALSAGQAGKMQAND